MQTHEAASINTEIEMKQASDAMREALKGDSAASAEMSDALQQADMSNAEPQADVEMVMSSKDMQHLCKLSCTVFASSVHSLLTQSVQCSRCPLLSVLNTDSSLKTWGSAPTSKAVHKILMPCPGSPTQL